MDLRLKVIAALEQGQSIRKVAKRFDISYRTVFEYKRKAAKNDLEPHRTGPRHTAKLGPDDLQKIRQLIEHNPGITLKQIAKHMSVPVAESTMSRTLKRMNISLKKSQSKPVSS